MIGAILNAINIAGIEILPSVDLKVRNPRYQGGASIFVR